MLILIGCKPYLEDGGALKNDSIKKWILNAKNKKKSFKERKKELSKVYLAIKLESSFLKYLPRIAYLNLKLQDTSLFKRQNKEALKYALKIKDSSVIGYTYRNYGLYYKKLFKYDSAFYNFNRAQIFFKNSPYKKAKIFVEKSYLYGELYDLNKSEEFCVKALKIFNKTENNYQVQSCYITLGIILKETKDYEEALKYYKKALKYKDKSYIYNNMGVVYKEMKDYKKAIFFFKKELLNNTSMNNYARVINNIANSRILSRDTLGVYSKIKEALFIRESLNSKRGVLSSYCSLRNYFIYSNDTLKVNFYLEKIKNTSFEIRNNKEYLNSLIYLAKYKPKNKSNYLEKYIRDKDSITRKQNTYLKKFAHYSYEKDNVIAENETLKEDKKYLFFIGVLLAVLTLVYFYINRIKSQNEKLLLENDQQKLNEELYLSSIEYQQNLKTLQIEERNRIAEELHDNILSKLFGVRLKLGFFPTNFDKKNQMEYDKYTKELQNIERDIRDVSHQLHTTSEPYAINFEDNLIALLEEKKKLGGFKLTFHKEECIYLDDLDNLIKINLYRILQEILQNIIKHAKASETIVTINSYKDKLQIIVQDNGIGFDVNRVKSGLGIKSIKSRIKKINGKIRFNTKNQENNIQILLPYKNIK